MYHLCCPELFASKSKNRTIIERYFIHFAEFSNVHNRVLPDWPGSNNKHCLLAKNIRKGLLLKNVVPYYFASLLSCYPVLLPKLIQQTSL